MTRVFPQLATGASVQYPFRQVVVRRTIATTAEDGGLLRLSDHNVRQRRWTVALSSISDSEMGSITDLFRETRGSLGEFTFLDPSANLLTWSERLDEATWEHDPLLDVKVVELAEAPAGRHTATLTSLAQTPQAIHQSIPAPARFTYALSFYARADERMLIEAGAVQAEAGGMRAVDVGTSWRRSVIELPGGPGDLPAFDVGIRIPPASRCFICGLQLEAQPGASEYRASAAISGIYTRARFDSDELRVVSRELGRHDTRFGIRARE